MTWCGRSTWPALAPAVTCAASGHGCATKINQRKRDGKKEKLRLKVRVHSSPAERGHHCLYDIDGDLEGRRSESEKHAAQATTHNIWMCGLRESLDPDRAGSVGRRKGERKHSAYHLTSDRPTSLARPPVSSAASAFDAQTSKSDTSLSLCSRSSRSHTATASSLGSSAGTNAPAAAHACKHCKQKLTTKHVTRDTVHMPAARKEPPR
jgi:hypothetical protein